MPDDNPFTAYTQQMLGQDVASENEDDALLALVNLFEYYHHIDQLQLVRRALARIDGLDGKIRTAVSGRTARKRDYDRETRRLRLAVETLKADGVSAAVKTVAERERIRVKTLKQRLGRARRDNA
jgi:hypothetical protein